MSFPSDVFFPITSTPLMDSTAWPTDERQEVSVQSYSQASDTAVFFNEEQ